MPKNLDNRIRLYWEKADTQSMKDQYLKKLEAKLIDSHITENDRVLDLGCGDGTGSQLYRRRCRWYVGFDRSARMLREFSRREPDTPLILGDIQSLPFGNTTRKFTVIITQRSLINLPDRTAQKLALRRISRILRPGNRLILCEAFQEGFARLNELRSYLGSQPIKELWHNIYLDRKLTAGELSGIMHLEKEEDLSCYYFLTRVVHQALVGEAVPQWNSPINRIAFEIAKSGKAPDFKGFSTIMLQIWRKKKEVN
ncbi:MAG: class I SAM-dependent methyltransferase [Candidatus Aminicenantes bacterium]|nr:MAG: class I SAM-dependent methyltransferase [Candidatus Aminicenantes bacterium]